MLLCVVKNSIKIIQVLSSISGFFQEFLNWATKERSYQTDLRVKTWLSSIMAQEKFNKVPISNSLKNKTIN